MPHYKSFIKFIAITMLGATSVQADTCLNGFELTAVVVQEINIRQAVSAYACEGAGYSAGIYHNYKTLRETWHKRRNKEMKLRDAVYQRIYRDDWQGQVDNWTQRIATEQNQLAVDAKYCDDLSQTIDKHTKDWSALYNNAAKHAASEAYDPLRCEKIEIK